MSLNLASFAVCHGFRVSKELLCGDAASQVGDNLFLRIDFCLPVLLLVRPARGTSMFALDVWMVLPCAYNKNTGWMCACTSYLPVLLLSYPTSPNLAMLLYRPTVEWVKRFLEAENMLWSKVPSFPPTSSFSITGFTADIAIAYWCTCRITPPGQSSAFTVEARKPSELDLMHSCFYYPLWYEGLMTKAGVELVWQSQSPV